MVDISLFGLHCS